MTIFQSFGIRLENVLGEIRTHELIGKTLQLLWPQHYNHYTNLSQLGNYGNYLLYNIFKIINKTIILQQKFQILNFQIWITFPRSGCSRYLKACSRPTLWLLSSHFGRMLEHPHRGKDIKHQSSIYLIKIYKTWDFLVEPPDFNH